MTNFTDYLNSIDNLTQRAKLAELLTWITINYPTLTPVIKWNQPMFLMDQTYIIGFSVSKKHFAISPEVKTLTQFMPEIEAAEYDHTANIVRVKWEQPIAYPLLTKMIDFNMTDKAGYTNFWR